MPNQDRVGSDYWSLIEPYWLPLNEAWDLPTSAFLAELHKTPSKVQHLYCGHWCQSEINNGGLHQFFFNTTGLLAPDALEAFRAIGLEEWSAVLDEAMRYFGTPYPRERFIRVAKLPEMRGLRENWDPFRALDDRFYDWEVDDHHRWMRVADLYAASA